eukprot:3552862-Lingulodinium_polyedra.AAC.1
MATLRMSAIGGMCISAATADSTFSGVMLTITSCNSLSADSSRCTEMPMSEEDSLSRPARLALSGAQDTTDTNTVP